MAADLIKKLRTKYIWLPILIMGIVFTTMVFVWYNYHQRHRRHYKKRRDNIFVVHFYAQFYFCYNYNALVFLSIGGFI